MKNEKVYLGSPDNPATAAVVCYITFIGWLIAYFGLYKYNKTAFTAIHIRQALLLHLLSFLFDGISILVLWRIIPYVIIVFLGAGLFILWIIGAFRAINGVEKPIPVIGDWAQTLFKRL